MHDAGYLHQVLTALVERDASDLILTVGAAPQLRVNGELEAVDAEELDAATTEGLVREVLETGQFDELQRKRSLDVSFGISGLARFRCNVYLQRGSYALAVRRIPFVVPSLTDLGLPDAVRDMARRPQGLVLVTGPTGSGKSTTLAAMVDHINRVANRHIVCIEQPIEYLHRHLKGTVDQIEVGQDALSFADALGTVVRQCPDVVMISSLHDPACIQAALNLAESGHLVLASVKTSDVPPSATWTSSTSKPVCSRTTSLPIANAPGSSRSGFVSTSVPG
jgi:twitching motility protein PilT